MTQKDRCKDFISDYENGTKSVRRIAEGKLIEICEPVIKSRYAVAKAYNQELDEIGREYDPLSGKIERIYEIREALTDNPHIVFTYRDVFTDPTSGDVREYKAYVDMPLSWLDEGSLESFTCTCRRRKIDYLKIAISYQKSQVETMEKELLELVAEEHRNGGDGCRA